MLKILAPCRPSDSVQLEKKIAILKEYIGNKYSVGLEIVGPANDFLNPKILETTIRNLSLFRSENLFFSIHFPFWSHKRASSPFNLACPKPIFYKAVEATAMLANEINAGVINIHPSTPISFWQRSAIKSNAELEERRKLILEKVRVNLVEIQAMFGRKVCLENMPPVYHSGYEANPRKVFYDICFFRSSDFLLVVEPAKNIFATVDTSHLAGALDSSQLLGEIKSLGSALGHVHFNDIGHRYQPFLAPFEDGLIPGEGGIGERVFKELLRYFVDYSIVHDLSVNIEVGSKDYHNPIELEESVKRIGQWLDEIKRN